MKDISPFAASDSQPFLDALARRFPTRDAALAEIAHLSAVLALPKGTVHVVSDVHGENKKLSHVIRNASGGLRTLVQKLFSNDPEDTRRTLLNLVYYADRTWQHLAVDAMPPAERDAFFFTTLDRLLRIARALAHNWSERAVERVFPAPWQELFRELFFESSGALHRDDTYLRALLQPLLSRGRGGDIIRLLSRVVRNLSVHELVVAGDLGDRGPRIDRVIEVLMKQPRVSIAWGNHDVAWMGACLGQEALIATVVRVSLRYSRIAQLEEGYGIPLEPLEKLARAVYGNDPATHFKVKGEGDRDPTVLARMQKAIAIMQFKLEGQAARRNPDFDMEERCLMHRIDVQAGTVTIDGRTHPLLDAALPTLDTDDPYALSPDEQRCIDALRASFLHSPTMWAHMQFIRKRGAMLLRRDHNLIFHGCLPVDDNGVFETFVVDDAPVGGAAMLQAFERVMHRAFRERRPRDVDLLWYLWTGKRSPLFGKDRMSTFETYFVADEEARKEHKNAWFKLVHDGDFCRRVFAELGADPAIGFIVNGHVPVRVEKGEAPLKKSGLAVTIDGAFSEAYGDRGYTLILEAGRTALAEHHHFESVDDAVRAGADIVPSVVDLRTFDSIRTVAQTEAGAAIVREIGALEDLVRAYDDNRVLES